MKNITNILLCIVIILMLVIVSLLINDSGRDIELENKYIEVACNSNIVKYKGATVGANYLLKELSVKGYSQYKIGSLYNLCE